MTSPMGGGWAFNPKLGGIVTRAGRHLPLATVNPILSI